MDALPRGEDYVSFILLGEEREASTSGGSSLRVRTLT
jgi:hypothetical protein